MPTLEEYYKVSSADMVAVANKIRTKGGTQAALEWPQGWSNAIDAIPAGSSENCFLENFNATWTDRSIDSPSSYALIIPDKRVAIFGAQALSILSTDNPIDFSNYTKLRIDVALSTATGQNAHNNNTMSRLSVSNGVIDNSNRGDNYVTFPTQSGSFELLLPENKNALYVGILCWSWCDLVVLGVTAE